ncbi:hypothetical protein AB0F81_14915, partial [Actinoplanes sp. NPDC024001]|uniref:hypothetical protein n=1 Tax=Actinoplanes sp. NPDC024001 TaxID=3154598 RepID=UPI0033E21555
RLAELRGRLGEAMRRADDRVGPILGYAAASDFLVLLRPAWWVLRGYLAAMALSLLFGNSGSPTGLLPRVEDNELLGLLLLAAMVVGSIWLGRRGRPAKPLSRFALAAATAGLMLFALVGFLEVDSGSRQSGYMDVSYVNEYGDVDDVFVYDSRGRLVQGVQLYDQNGRPLHFGDDYCEDPATGEWQSSRRLGYPRCPEQAPFLMATPNESGPVADAPTAEPSAEPSEAAPSPSASATVTPPTKAAPSPSVSK